MESKTKWLDQMRLVLRLKHMSIRILMASLLYGAGLRLMEGVRLRVKDLDFAYYQIVVRDGKGAQDRVTILPYALAEQDVSTTMVYTYVLQRGGKAVRSPLDPR